MREKERISLKIIPSMELVVVAPQKLEKQMRMKIVILKNIAERNKMYGLLSIEEIEHTTTVNSKTEITVHLRFNFSNYEQMLLCRNEMLIRRKID